MLQLKLFFFFIFLSTHSFAQKLSGKITSTAGEPLPFSSITIQNNNTGTNANNQGFYFLDLQPGTYTIICRHVGFERQEKTIKVSDQPVQLNFELKEQQVSLKEVVVKAGAEDPAYAIIRRAIKKRKEYLNENEVFECEVYSKGAMNLRNFPKKFFGQKIDFEDGDSSKRKMIYLSETVSKLSVDKPNKVKVDVLSTRVSGQSDGYGFAGARFFSFYENIVQISNSLNPRGFVSPIAETALSMYRYKYEGAFSEDGKLINKIKVIPKRKYEPCFSGYINIVEDDWRIHSLQLMLTKESQMNFADTLRIEQLYQMMGVNQWLVQSQVLYPSVKLFGFDAFGSFANVYRNFNLNPTYDKKYFNNTILKYETGSNKKPLAYWDSIRPLALSNEETKDYIKKDSLEQRRKDPAYLDSLDKKNNKIKILNIIFSGKNISNQKKKLSYTIPSLLQAIQFNTVEGWVLNAPVTLRKEYTDRKSISFTPHLRYGFSSQTFYGWGTVRYNYGKKYFSNITVSGGKRIYQINNDNPLEPLQNTIGSLLYRNNFMKLYAADYGRINFTKGVGGGLTIFGNVQYQNRSPLENTTDFTWNTKAKHTYLPNYPSELVTKNFAKHQAAIATIGFTIEPKPRYIEFPDRTINIGSRWPVFSAQYTKGFKSIFGSDVDFDKWQIGVRDNLNLKLYGRLSYKVEAGGFLNNNLVELQDLKHFPGNRLFASSDFLTIFQLPQYYKFSTRENKFASAFAEHHFNGFLTNKIPGFKKLNWNLVAGVAFLSLPTENYFEWHFGFENIFRIFRIDLVTGYQKGSPRQSELRLGSTFAIGRSED